MSEAWWEQDADGTWAEWWEGKKCEYERDEARRWAKRFYHAWRTLQAVHEKVADIHYERVERLEAERDEWKLRYEGSQVTRLPFEHMKDRVMKLQACMEALQQEREDARNIARRLRYELHELQARRCATCNAFETCAIRRALWDAVDDDKWHCSEWQG